jgi:hypothetical protein
MLLKILGRHRSVCAVQELHFFEWLWSPADGRKVIPRDEALTIFARLAGIQRDGLYTNKNWRTYLEEAGRALPDGGPGYSRVDVYKTFLACEAASSGKQIPCEKTPQNVFYLGEILQEFPDCRIINMVRDPRDVLLSQKKKWKMRGMGALYNTRFETFRLWANYHPLVISRLWNSSIHAYLKYAADPRLTTVRFEDLVAAPEKTVSGICDFLELEYDPAMLDIPFSASSFAADDAGSRGIRKDTAERSRRSGGLSPAETIICQETCGPLMARFDYRPRDVARPRWRLVSSRLSLPFKLSLALSLNLHRMRSVADTVKRRLGRT